MKILHHDDLDGRCAAAIVLLKFSDAECIEMTYSTPVPFDRVERDEPVIIVDFSLQQPGDWQRLFEITQDVVWIDHHETAIKKAEDLIVEIDQNNERTVVGDLYGFRRTDRCGAWLTWEYLHVASEFPPPVVDIIDRWDRWTHKDAPEVLNFVSGSKLHDTRPQSDFWGECMSEETGEYLVSQVQDAGAAIRRYQEIQDSEAVRRFAFPIVWEYHPCAVLFTDRAGSKLFDSLEYCSDPLGLASVWIAVNFDGKQYTVHLYSDTIKVNDIAVKYGGGGHPGAAGFVCEKLPWTE